MEELQLRSQDLDSTTQDMEIELSGVDQPMFKQSIPEINAQALDLDIKPHVLKALEETDEDDDDDYVKSVTML